MNLFQRKRLFQIELLLNKARKESYPHEELDLLLYYKKKKTQSSWCLHGAFTTRLWSLKLWKEKWTPNQLQNPQPARHAGAIVALNLWGWSTNIWFNLRPTLGEAAHTLNCMDG